MNEEVKDQDVLLVTEKDSPSPKVVTGPNGETIITYINI